MARRLDTIFVRNLVFGVEDSLVSTVGLLSGIASENLSHATILATGIIYISVEALSMAVGSYLSEESAQDADKSVVTSVRSAAFGALVMLVSFVVAGFVPIIPYLIFSGTAAVLYSILLSLVVLFVLGYLPLGGASSRNAWGRAFRMALLGGLAIVVGVAVAHVFGVS